MDAWAHISNAGPLIPSEPDVAEVHPSRDERIIQAPLSQATIAPYALNPLLSGVLEQLEYIERFDLATILMLEDDALLIRAIRSPIVTCNVQDIPVDLARCGTIRTLLSNPQPQIVVDRAADAEELAYLKTLFGDTQAAQVSVLH